MGWDMSCSTNFPGGRVRWRSKAQTPPLQLQCYEPTSRTAVPPGLQGHTVLRSTSASAFSSSAGPASVASSSLQKFLHLLFCLLKFSCAKEDHSYLHHLQNRLSDELSVTVIHQSLDILHSFTVIFPKPWVITYIKWNWNLIWKWNWQNLAVYRTICND